MKSIFYIDYSVEISVSSQAPATKLYVYLPSQATFDPAITQNVLNLPGRKFAYLSIHN